MCSEFLLSSNEGDTKAYLENVIIFFIDLFIMPLIFCITCASFEKDKADKHYSRGYFFLEGQFLKKLSHIDTICLPCFTVTE